MTKYVQKGNYYRAKQEEPRERFGFSYNRENINYRTEIPDPPEKAKVKPDAKRRDLKIQQINERIRQLKDQRRQKKNKKKVIEQSYQSQTEQYKQNVLLGKKCIKVLQYDLQNNRSEISKINYKINNIHKKTEDLIYQIKDLRLQNRPNKKQNRPFEQMSNRQLDQQKRRIQFQMSTKSLTKKQEIELNTLLTKIGRIKSDATRKIPEEQSSNVNNQKLLQLQNDKQKELQKLQKLKTIRYALFNQKKQIQFKILCIEQDINQFIQEITNIADKYDEKSQEKLLDEEARQLKEKIYEERQKIVKINEEFQEKVKQFEVQQEKIKWIKWATEVQNQKRQEWQQEKAERKRQKLKQKNSTTDKKEGEKKEGEKKDGDAFNEQKKTERKKINRNQKQIDICSFLIQYCKRLLPNQQGQKLQELAPKKEVDIQKELTKGSWAKQKGVQILHSKKSKKDQQDNSIRYNKKKEETKEESVGTNKFNHDYFVSQTFDSVRIIPPTSVEELDKIIKDLQDKVEYYLSHPDEGIEQKFAKDKKYIDKNLTAPTSNNYKPNNSYNKDYKAKASTKIINTEQFPHLS